MIASCTTLLIASCTSLRVTIFHRLSIIFHMVSMIFRTASSVMRGTATVRAGSVEVSYAARATGIALFGVGDSAAPVLAVLEPSPNHNRLVRPYNLGRN
jgi:hypothetical protein